ncbi:coiled coil domain-containing protein [Idiomarina seosinensis]|uniref:Coiled coil domain-containing protein n=1 Tax=Idiomarina seosinensis TaxID=281739 RepID=A0A432ZE07_9GAMM|nr:coiled coil domain-containing protein [Idiomarina seosinensis]RUO76139.1 coiled coil domain-containing protein [Idiomarina seosinensis]
MSHKNDDKDAFEKKHQAKIDEMKAEIDRLKAKARQAEAESQVKYEQKIKELETLKDEAEERLDSLKKSSKDAWSDISGGLESATQSLATAIKAASKEFK